MSYFLRKYRIELDKLGIQNKSVNIMHVLTGLTIVFTTMSTPYTANIT